MDMRSQMLCFVLLGAAFAVAGSSPLASSHEPPATQDVVNRDAQVMADFSARVDEYVALHRRVEGTLDRLPKEATPAQLDVHQRLFASRLAEARKGERQGAVFTPPMQEVVRRLVARLFADRQARRQLRDSIMDDNPGAGRVKLAVNARYPDDVPLSTMPPEVLKNLPPLPAELEYRFVGETLILLDPDAHLVVDFVPRALPRS
jgi:hypothetical protein